jgi:hypothetical protein
MLRRTYSVTDCRTIEKAHFENILEREKFRRKMKTSQGKGIHRKKILSYRTSHHR